MPMKWSTRNWLKPTCRSRQSIGERMAEWTEFWPIGGSMPPATGASGSSSRPPPASAATAEKDSSPHNAASTSEPRRPLPRGRSLRHRMKLTPPRGGERPREGAPPIGRCRLIPWVVGGADFSIRGAIMRVNFNGTTNRRLCLNRRLQNGGIGGSRRLDRLVCGRNSIRQHALPRSGDSGQWSLAHCSEAPISPPYVEVIVLAHSSSKPNSD